MTKHMSRWTVTDTVVVVVLLMIFAIGLVAPQPPTTAPLLEVTESEARLEVWRDGEPNGLAYIGLLPTGNCGICMDGECEWIWEPDADGLCEISTDLPPGEYLGGLIRIE